MNNKPVGKKFVILQFFLLKKICIESEVCFLCPSSAYQMKNILHSTFTFRPAICAKIFIALSIFFTYPLQFYVVFDIFKKHIDPYIKDNYRTVTDIMARTFGVLCSVGIGIALPLLEQIINIVGACFYSILGLVIPGIIETVFRWENLGKCKWILWKNVLIIIFGVFSLVSGCTVTIMDIIEILHRKIE